MGGMYLLTGGFGRIGALLAEHLARTVRARLILVGGLPLPDRPSGRRGSAATPTRTRSAGGFDRSSGSKRWARRSRSRA